MRPIHADYPAARARFHAACKLNDCVTATWEHPLTGRHDEPLGADVGALGPADASHVIVVVSGTHGVEGYAGSALQSAWLESEPTLPADVRVVVLHAINPYGFSYDRRVNEDNVDLNRNFVDWEQPTPRNVEYDAIANLVVPGEWTAEAQQTSTEALFHVVAEQGLEQFQQTVSSGQYHHPTGIFYGGTKPVWSHRTLREIVTEHCKSAQRATIIDLHTGLGPWGHGELISSEPTTSAAFHRASALWGDVTSIVDGSSVSANIGGEWFSEIAGWVPDVEITAGALEYGTVDSVSVLQALRGDAWRSGAEAVTPEQDEEIRLQLRAAFLDEGNEWAEALWDRYVEVLGAALNS